MPFMQSIPIPHMCPHIPQLWLSVWRLTHPEPGQINRGIRHMHTPATHWLVPQEAPHIPQFLGSLERSAQTPITHMAWLIVVHLHWPATHWPTPQECPHVPQLLALVCTSTQAPLHIAKPGMHPEVIPLVVVLVALVVVVPLVVVVVPLVVVVVAPVVVAVDPLVVVALDPPAPPLPASTT
jgi:hypothetical protein